MGKKQTADFENGKHTNSGFLKMEKNKQQILKTGKKQTADFKIDDKNRKKKKQKKTDKIWKIKIEKNRKKTEKYLFPTLQTQAGTVTCKGNGSIRGNPRKPKTGQVLGWKSTSFESF